MKQKHVFVFLINLLPWYVLKNYIIITFFLFIYTHEKKVVSEKDIDLAKLQEILKMTCNHKTILFPYATMEWLWKENILDNEIALEQGNMVTIRSILKTKKDVIENTASIIDVFLKNLPKKFYSRVFRQNKYPRVHRHNRIKEVTDIRLALGKTLMVLT